MIRNLICIGFVLVCTALANAQWYYPLGLGNRWEFWEAFPPPHAYAWTTRIVGDTTMPNARTYRILRSDHWWPDEYQRQAGTIVYGYFPYPTGREAILFDFSKNVGDTVTVTYWAFDTTVTTVMADHYAQVFGRSLRVKEFYERSIRSSMYVIRSIAESIGMVIITYEPGMGGNLGGAIIDGVQYGTITDLNETASEAPHSPVLQQNYPNPFNPNTTIEFLLPKEQFVVVRILDVLGREVDRVFSGKGSQGRNVIQWNASDRATGVYVVRMETAEFTQTRKLLLLR